MMFFVERDIAIDMGTNNTLLYVSGKGIRLREPTIVAVDRQTGLNRRKHSDAEILKTEESTGCHTCSHHDHSHGNGRTFPGKYPDDQNCTESQQEGQQMKVLRSFCINMADQFRKFTSSGAASKKFGYLHQDNCYSDSRNKTAHDRCGYKANDPARIRQEEKQKPDSCQQGNGRNQF